MNRELSDHPNEAAHLPGEPASPGLSADDRLEIQIEATRQALLAAVSKPMQRELAEQLKMLIGQRPPWKIAQMERERGLG